jgi:molybdopterin-biosynthesis enzyme MoeA-like protein
MIKKSHKTHGKYLYFIVLPDKSIISPHVPKKKLTHLDGIKQSQILQTDINHIIITAKKEVHFTPQTEVEIHKSMNKVFKNQIDIQIKSVETFGNLDHTKFQVIESKTSQEFLSDMIEYLYWI